MAECHCFETIKQSEKNPKDLALCSSVFFAAVKFSASGQNKLHVLYAKELQ